MYHRNLLLWLKGRGGSILEGTDVELNANDGKGGSIVGHIRRTKWISFVGGDVSHWSEVRH